MSDYQAHYKKVIDDLRALFEAKRKEAAVWKAAYETEIGFREQEPVAWEFGAEVYWGDSPELSDYIRKEGTPLYTSPPASKPLTDEEIKRMAAPLFMSHYWNLCNDFARAIETAHGIHAAEQLKGDT